MLKKLSLLVVLAFLAQSSYSESIAPYYGYTGNTAANGHSWSMDTYFPDGVPGLDVQNIIYNYTIRKQVQDRVDVTIQNENGLGSGYVFRETDSWMPGSLDGTQINKVVPVIPNLPREAWGDGSIVVDGPGSVEDPNVVYTYRVDPCYDPQFDPNCPGYQVPVPVIPEVDLSSIYDATKDENVDLTQEIDDETYEDEEKELSEEELAEKEAEEERDSKERLEKALAAADNSAMFAQAMAQGQVLQSMNAAVNMTNYYTATIPGGTYKESVVLQDKDLPDNKQGLRNNYAQQKLHKEMVDMQY